MVVFVQQTQIRRHLARQRGQYKGCINNMVCNIIRYPVCYHARSKIEYIIATLEVDFEYCINERKIMVANLSHTQT